MFGKIRNNDILLADSSNNEPSNLNMVSLKIAQIDTCTGTTDADSSFLRNEHSIPVASQNIDDSLLINRKITENYDKIGQSIVYRSTPEDVNDKSEKLVTLAACGLPCTKNSRSEDPEASCIAQVNIDSQLDQAGKQQGNLDEEYKKLIDMVFTKDKTKLFREQWFLFVDIYLRAGFSFSELKIPANMMDENLFIELIHKYGFAVLEILPDFLVNSVKIIIAGLNEIKASILSYTISPETIGKMKELLSKDEYSDLAKKVGIINYYNWELIPDSIKDSNFYTETCKNDALAFWYVPDKFYNKEVCEAACMNQIYNLKWIPLDSPYYDDLCVKCISKDPTAIKYIAREKKTLELCLMALKLDITALPLVVDVLEYGKDFYYQDIREAIEKGAEIKKLLPFIDENDKRALVKSYMKKCIRNIDYEVINDIPGFAQEVKRHKWVKVHFEQGITLAVKSKASVFINKADFYEYLISEEHSLAEKNQLVKELDKPTRDGYTRIPISELFTVVNPIITAPWTYNPFVEELLFACYYAVGFQPETMQIGTALQAYLDNNPKEFILLEKGLSSLQMEVCGGRTVRMKINHSNSEFPTIDAREKSVVLSRNQTIFHYKFLRKGESLEELVQEGNTCQYLNNLKNADHGLCNLKSDIPTPVGYFKILQKHLPDICHDFNDPIQLITGEDGYIYAYCYCYQANLDYCRYAHTAEPDPLEIQPFLAAEEGLLKGIYDVGVLAKAGIIMRDVLPAFHDTQSGRNWIMFRALLSSDSSCNYPGTFGAWNTDATERPDFGYGGLRDFGDFELFGAFSQILNVKDARSDGHPSAVLQRGAYVNYTCHALLSILLLYARLHATDEQFHYKSANGIAACMNFVDRCLNAFLSGLQPDGIDDMKTLLDISPEIYQRLLERVSKELLYFTAPQPEVIDMVDGNMDDHKWPECYSMHINKQHALDPELFPGVTFTDMFKFPDDFINCNHKINLGRKNGIFLPTTTINLFAKIWSAILITHGDGFDINRPNH